MPTELLSGLWIGDVNDIYNREFYIDNNINIVINCTRDQGFLDLPHLKKVRIPLSNVLDMNNDIYTLNMKQKEITEFIYNSIELNNIFVYCHNGITVSPLIVALFMIRYGEISLDTIRDILRSKNRNICLDYDLSIFNS